MINIRTLCYCVIALSVAPAARATLIFGTSATIPLPFNGTVSDGDMQFQRPFGIEFTAASGLDYVLTGMAVPLENIYYPPSASVTFSVFTAVPRTTLNGNGTEEPGDILDSTTFSILYKTNVGSGGGFEIYSPSFAGGAILRGGTKYYLIGRMNDSGGTTQMGWASTLGSASTMAVKVDGTPWSVFLTTLFRPEAQVFGDAFAPEPATMGCVALGLLLAARFRRKSILRG